MAVKKTSKKAVTKAPAKRLAPKKAVKKKNAEQSELISESASAEVQEILNRLFSEVQEPIVTKEQTRSGNRGEKNSVSKPSFPRPNLSKPSFPKPQLATNFAIKERQLGPSAPIKFTTPAILVLVLVISGFWGRQIVGLLGVPTNPAPFTSLYFEDPHISGLGIIKGSTLTFGMHNGYPKTKTINWKVSIADRTYRTGKVELKAFTSQNVDLLVNSGQPGDFLTISDDALKASISAVISQ